MGGKDGSPGGGTFTLPRLVAVGVDVVGFFGTMIVMFSYADHRPWLVLPALILPFVVVAALTALGGWLVEWHERRTGTGIYESE